VLLASLWWLEDHEEPPTQTRLAGHAGTDPMMTSQVTRRLEARGLLERAPDPADGRARRLRLTAAGSSLVSRALTDVEAADEEFFAALGRRRGAFLDALTLLAAEPRDRAS
jgi:DNA-binding MarR family transcriptional regulator